MRIGNNIRQRKDGRFEARYEKGRDDNGHIIYGYCYGSTYDEAEIKRSRAVNKTINSKQMNLLILGCGDHGNEVKEIARQLRIFNRIAFLDDAKTNHIDVIGCCEKFSNYLDEYPIAIPAIGDNSIRCKWMHELICAGFIIPTLIHSSVVVPESANIGPGTVVCAGATIGHNVTIGKGCIIDSGAIVTRNANVPAWTLVNCGELFQ